MVAITNRWLQYAGALAGSLSTFVAGMHFVWASPSLPRLYSNESTIPITVTEGSWIASMELFADLPGAPLGAFAGDYLGRKNSLLCVAFPLILSWFLIAYATNALTIIFAKFLVGVADGSVYTILPMFIGEIVEDDIRGKLGNCMTVMFDFGALFLYSIAPWISLRTLALIGAVFPILYLLALFKVPETPYYLLMKGKYSEAKESLQKYRGKSDVEQEFIKMSKVVEKQMGEKSSWLELWRNKVHFRATMILIGLKTMQMFCGIYVILVFAETVFHNAGGILPASITTIIFGGVQFLSGFFAMLIVDKVGRRPLLIISNAGCGIALVFQAAYFYIQFYKLYDLEQYNWVPISAMLVYIIMYSVGLGAIPLMVPSEMLATNIKAKAMCITDLYLALTGFAVVYAYQNVVLLFGNHVPFFMFAVSCFISIFFVIYVMPETKGRSLEEIQEMLRGDIGLSLPTTSCMVLTKEESTKI